MGKWIAFIIGAGVILFMGFVVVLELGFSTPDRWEHTWQGTEVFTTIDDALDFQEEVIKEAEKLTDVVYSARIRQYSPPKVVFDIYTPNLTHFPYGEKSQASKFIWISRATAIIFGLTTPIAVYFTFKNLIRLKDNNANTSD